MSFKATVTMADGSIRQVVCDYYYERGEPQTWDCPGSPEIVDLDRIEDATTGEPVTGELAEGETERLVELAEEAHEADVIAYWEDVAQSRDDF